jgi:hypothetical protein
MSQSILGIGKYGTLTVCENFEYLYGVVSEIYGKEHPGHGKMSLPQ